MDNINTFQSKSFIDTKQLKRKLTELEDDTDEMTL